MRIEREYTIRRLSTFTKSRTRKAWSVVARTSDLDVAKEEADSFAADGRARYAVFRGRVKVYGARGARR